ncbi:MAG: GDP-mannose 4,6-dehydratase [Verrucomicrobia bacterium]|nr:GDP-mannose 4,6-dehydratase [Verrucomicrobiota bacterium]
MPDSGGNPTTGTVWITGAAGFSARYLATLLRREHPTWHMIGLDRSPADRGDLDAYHSIDITDFQRVKELAQAAPPRWVFHLAAAIPPATEEALWHVNVGGTRVLIEAVAGGAAERVRVLVTSSAAVYGESMVQINEGARACGINTYGRSKWAQELVALAAGREFGVDVVIARTFNLIGPGLPERLLAGAVCAQCIRSGAKRIRVGDLSAFRDFIDIRDAVEAYCRIVQQGRTHGIYNVCSGRATRVRTMVGQLIKLAGGGLSVEESGSRSKGREVARSWGDNSQLKALGWQPSFSLRRSLKDMLEHSSNHS